MNDLVMVSGDKLTTTSKIVADVFNKVHRVVLKSIEDLDCSDSFRQHNFMLSYYTSPQNKKIKCYNITKDGFYFLCMGFTGKKAAQWKESYIAAFNEMEVGLLNVDAEITRLSNDKTKIKQMGSEWSAFGREINRQKKSNDFAIAELMDKVQFKLELQ